VQIITESLPIRATNIHVPFFESSAIKNILIDVFDMKNLRAFDREEVQDAGERSKGVVCDTATNRCD